MATMCTLERIDDLTAFAADIAPHIDRLAIAVHRHAAPKGRALIESFGLPNGGILIDLRAPLLGGAITFDDVATINRYAPRDGLQHALDEHLAHGMLERIGVRYTLTGRGRDLLTQLTAGQGEAITALWSDQASSLPALIETATTVVTTAAGLEPASNYPAFTLMYRAPDPPSPTAAHLLLTRLTTLRYFRADAHAKARQAHTDRDAVEADTNLRAAPPWAELEPGTRTAFVNGLAQLPD